MAKIIIMQGVPGSGKSTLVRKHYPEAEVVSADDYFMSEGKYKFDPNLLPAAHAACLRIFIGWCGDFRYIKTNRVMIVDNTNTTVIEIAPYMAIAQAYGHDAEIFYVQTNVNVAFERNIHGVPLDKMWVMHDRIIDSHKMMPPWWKFAVFSEK